MTKHAQAQELMKELAVLEKIALIDKPLLQRTIALLRQWPAASVFSEEEIATAVECANLAQRGTPLQLLSCAILRAKAGT